MFDKFKNKESLYWVLKIAEGFHPGYIARSWDIGFLCVCVIEEGC